jgi:uncharacterized membrane protein
MDLRCQGTIPSGQRLSVVGAGLVSGVRFFWSTTEVTALCRFAVGKWFSSAVNQTLG